MISIAFLLVWEMTEKEPVVDLSLFRDRNFALGVLIISFGFMAFFGSVVIFPLWLQTVMGYTAGLAGLATAPVGILALVFSPMIGKNMHRLDLRVVASFAFHRVRVRVVLELDLYARCAVQSCDLAAAGAGHWRGVLLRADDDYHAVQRVR